MLCTKASLWYAWYHSADTFFDGVFAKDAIEVFERADAFFEGVFDKDDIEVFELRLEGGWLMLASESSRSPPSTTIFLKHFHPDEDSTINWFTFAQVIFGGAPIIMRGSYTTNFSGRRWCSRRHCFGSSNDFIFCSTHSSTSLLRNKKRLLPTKSWVSPFLHRYESLANSENQCGCQSVCFRWQSKQLVFFVKSKVTLHFEKIQTLLRWLHDFHASQASCYKDTEFLWWSTPPPAHSRTHFVLFTSVPRV